MTVYRMLVAYDGSPFRGFARQEGLSTVQGRIEEALSKILREQVKVTGAGRTDAGVHALGQVVSFSPAAPAPDLGELKRGLNALCRPAIAVLEITQAEESFDARRSALRRRYEYALLTREVHDPFSERVAWHHPGPLDVAAMRAAAAAILGEHDFRSFGRVEEGMSPFRRLESLEIEEPGEDLVLIRAVANSFIQQMVRSIVGTLVWVGEGRLAPPDMERILHSHDRSQAGPVAPPHGLFLVSVDYA